MKYLNCFLISLLTLFFISCSVNKNTNQVISFIKYNQEKNETIISKYFHIDTVSIIGDWKKINSINNKTIPYHTIGLKNQFGDKIILIGSFITDGADYDIKLSPSENVKEIAQNHLFELKMSSDYVKQHKTDDKTFYTFSSVKDNIYKMTLIGGGEKCKYQIELFPKNRDEEKNLKLIIELFQSINPK
jgi:hypothetical protein